jgi:hypothetical protein
MFLSGLSSIEAALRNSGGGFALGLINLASCAPFRAERTWACHITWLARVSFFVMGRNPSESDALATEDD